MDLHQNNSEASTCLTCTNSYSRNIRSRVRRDRNFHIRNKRSETLNEKLNRYNENQSISNVRSVFKFPSGFHKKKNRVVNSNHRRLQRKKQQVNKGHKRFHPKPSISDFLHSDNNLKTPKFEENAMNARVFRRELEQFYYIPTTTQKTIHENADSVQNNFPGNFDVSRVTIAENIYDTLSSDPLETNSNIQQETSDESMDLMPANLSEISDGPYVTLSENIFTAQKTDPVDVTLATLQDSFKKDFQTAPSVKKARDVSEEISYEKLDKLLNILNQQLDDESSDIENKTDLGLITSAINSTIAQKISSDKQESQVSKSLIAVIGFLIIMAVICQSYSTYLKYYEYKIKMKTTQPAERVSFFEFYFNRHRNKTDLEQLLVEDEMLDPILKESREVLTECVEVALDKLCLESDSKLEQKYSQPEHLENLKKHLYSTNQ